MYSLIKKRKNGLIDPRILERAEVTKRVYDLELSQTKQFAFRHRGGVACISIDRTEQQYLLEGAGNGTIHIYDLDRTTEKYQPVACAKRQHRHRYTITSVAWYPSDNGLFITSGYDSVIKIWDTNEMKTVEEFDLECRVHSQAMSSIASHSLVASAADEPRIRLCDLDSGAFTHSLTGHNGPVLSCIWSTNQEFVLYSGGADGKLLAWDIRKASSCIQSFDQNNSDLSFETAHRRGIHGLTITPDGNHLVSFGLDEKIRLWDTYTGQHLFVNYGSLWRNKTSVCFDAAISGSDVWPPLLYVPSNDRQILIYRLLDGQLVKRLKGAYGRVTCVESRESHQQLYSGSDAGDILVWEPPYLLSTEERTQSDRDEWSSSSDEENH
ncbi:excision repair cross-complementing rodent repair deficiency, complementation group 8 [Sporodiniella umbellata]|nr:excision repair cross-complementing rodent repair deficiency, complementation group 8 [Sporodiniella umbellata]